jgi:hypothetical protein
MAASAEPPVEPIHIYVSNQCGFVWTPEGDLRGGEPVNCLASMNLTV